VVFHDGVSVQPRSDHKVIAVYRLRYTFLAGKAGEEMKEIGTGSTQLLSTECMNCTFTGCFVGLTAQGDCEAKYRYFDVSVPANE